MSDMHIQATEISGLVQLDHTVIGTVTATAPSEVVLRFISGSVTFGAFLSVF